MVNFKKKHVSSMSCRLKPAICSHDTGQQIPCFDRFQLIITWMSNIKEVHVNQGCMSLSTYYLEESRHLARLHRRHRAYVPTSNIVSHDNHEKINSWVSFSFLYGYGAPLDWRIVQTSVLSFYLSTPLNRPLKMEFLSSCRAVSFAVDLVTSLCLSVAGLWSEK